MNLIFGFITDNFTINKHIFALPVETKFAAEALGVAIKNK